jgi:hypothetical protein
MTAHDDALAATLREAGKDAEHLSLLRILWVVNAWLSVLGVVASLGYVAVGVFLRFLSATPNAGDAPPAFVGWLMSGIGVLFVAGFTALAALQFATARALKERRSKTLVQVAAAIAFLNLPLGTALGVFTFVVLGRPSVSRLFAEGEARDAGVTARADR